MKIKQLKTTQSKSILALIISSIFLIACPSTKETVTNSKRTLPECPETPSASLAGTESDTDGETVSPSSEKATDCIARSDVINNDSAAGESEKEGDGDTSTDSVTSNPVVVNSAGRSSPSAVPTLPASSTTSIANPAINTPSADYVDLVPGEPSELRWVQRSWLAQRSEKQVENGTKFRLPDGFSSLSFNSTQENQDLAQTSCPGSSFMKGLLSYHLENSNDRSHQLRCQFLEDGLSQPVKKGSCSFQPINTYFKKDFEQFKCEEGFFMAGISSKFKADPNDKSGRTGDRMYEIECCEMKSFDDKKVLFMPNLALSKEEEEKSDDKDKYLCEPEMPYNLATIYGNPMLATTDVNSRGETIDIMCPNDTLLRNLESRYYSNATSTTDNYVTASERIFSYQCCQFQTEDKITEIRAKIESEKATQGAVPQ